MLSRHIVRGVLIAVFACRPTFAGISASLTPSIASPAPLGSVVRWNASAAGASSVWYRFRARPAGSPDTPFRTIVDYGPKTSLDWTIMRREGAYEVEVSARNNTTGETAETSSLFEFTPLAVDVPVITATSHPLVFLYSAPRCDAGASMRVVYQGVDGSVQLTPYQPCDSTYSMNFYLAGLRPNFQYTAQHEITSEDNDELGAPVALSTGDIPFQAPRAFLLSGPSPSAGVLLQSVINGKSMATDLNGNIVWYTPDMVSFLTRPSGHGTFLGIMEDGAKDASQQTVREFDLTGITRAETNAARVSEQLAAMGLHRINSFHHEARKLPDGSYLVLAGSERILNDVQGSGPVDVLGDTVIILGPDLQVTWAWDAFDHLDPHQAAVLGETCAAPASLACSTFYQANRANDWLHTNAAQLTPDGNILLSIRHLDLLIKIDYANGSGTGNILWRLGAGGDFQLNADDASAWFSHQHDATFLSDGSMLLFDNGNTRIANAQSGNSRGQRWQIDEANMVATPILNADLGASSSALGTAQLLPNGNYHFDAGFIADPAAPATRIARALEVDPDGRIVWGMQVYAQEYRSFRMSDLYTPPVQ